MAKFYSAVGFASQIETKPGVYEEVITERHYYGDSVRVSRKLLGDDQVIPDVDLSVTNQLSIVADAYAYENFFAIRYIRWMGAPWTIRSVDVERPRLLFKLGGLYNGPTP